MFNLGKSKKQKEQGGNSQPVQQQKAVESSKPQVEKTFIKNTQPSRPQTNKKTSNMNNTVGKDTEFEGTIKSKGQLQIDGLFKGTLNSEGKLILTESGHIEGDIFCKDIELAGEVSGNVKARGKVTIKPGARVKGDIRYYEIEIESGANITCTISRMNPDKTNNNMPKSSGVNTAKSVSPVTNPVMSDSL